ncbi:alpha/beta hydrolase family protein [Actinomycetospora flava]|uniref:Alpha/beta family hydrolase n=1 Tax=Actinomycetospora flava TaxID=3129232 RepID=A0ABU8MA67_9PSEU
MTDPATTVDTPHGPAAVHLDEPGGAPRGLLVLGHGAGGGVEAPDLLGARSAAREAGLAVARVLQPYRVANRKAPPPAAHLDVAWAAVVEHLTAALPGVPQVHGGRSSGARVACRGAAALGPVAVLALAFPLLAPARRDGTRPDRGPEIDAVTVPVLAVSGERDRFGIPEPTPTREVVVLAGDHSLKARGPVAAAVGPWLERVLAPVASVSPD